MKEKIKQEKKIYTSFHDIPVRDYMYFPKGTLEVGKPGKFSRIEIFHLIISLYLTDYQIKLINNLLIIFQLFWMA